MSDTGPQIPRPRAGTDRGGETFAALIINGRRDRGLTQDELVAASGVSRATISRWERGDATAPNPAHIRAVAAALRIEPRDILVALGYLTSDELAKAS